MSDEEEEEDNVQSSVVAGTPNEVAGMTSQVAGTSNEVAGTSASTQEAVTQHESSQLYRYVVHVAIAAPFKALFIVMHT